MRILLLDDDDRVRFNLKLFLQDEGLECIDFTNAEDALTSLVTESYQVAIVDIRLPGKNGEEFIIAAKSIAPDLQIVVHTGTANYTIPPELVEMGVSQFAVLYKPVENMNAILETINKLVN